MVINTNPAADLTEQFNLTGFQPGGSAQVWQYGKAQDTAQSQTTDGSSALANFNTTLSLNGNNFSYTFPAYSMTVLDVGRAVLTVTANSVGKIYGAADPAFSASYAGFANGDDRSVLGGVLSFTTNEPGSGYAPVGTYQVRPSGLTSSKYSIAFAAGTLSVTAAGTSTVVTSGSSSSIYGQSVTFTATVTPASGSRPTGRVQFQIDGGNVGSPVTLSGGAATYSISTLAVGSHSVVAVYSGDGNFSGSSSPTLPQTVISANGNLDADGNGTADALSDGILILRYLFDPTGAWNVSDALGSGATRTTRQDIKSFLDGGKTTVLDADGNGTADALSDGILILRYLFDPTGAWNVNDALGSGATRTTRRGHQGLPGRVQSGPGRHRGPIGGWRGTWQRGGAAADPGGGFGPLVCRGRTGRDARDHGPCSDHHRRPARRRPRPNGRRRNHHRC